MSTTSKFRVHCFGFRAIDLPAKDRCGTSDPYFRGDFDKFKTFKSEWVSKNCSPTWKHEIRFIYETRFPNKLDKKSFKIEVWDHDKIGSDNFIGSVCVDLHTLAAGPVEHDLLLRDGTKPAGRILFSVTMEQIGSVTCTLKQVSAEELREGAADFQLIHYYSGKTHSKCKSVVARTTANPTWEELELMQFEATMHELMQEAIVIEVRKGNADKFATTELRFQKHLVLAENQLVRFSEPLLNPSGARIGALQGIISFRGVPQFGQMKAGKHTEDGIIGGIKLRDDLPSPANVVQRSQPTTAAPAAASAAGGPAFGGGPAAAAAGGGGAAAGGGGGMYPSMGGMGGAGAGAGAPAVGGWSTASPMARMQALAHKAAASQGFATSVGAPPAQSSAIPSGWVEKEDPITGRKFYVNTTTGESRWEMPATAEDAAAENEFTGATTEGQMESALPDGWIEQTDHATGRTFYVHTPTGRTQWDRPASRTSSPTLERRATSPVLGRPASGTFPAGVVAPTAVAAAPGGLPEGWIEQKDPASGRPFYVHTLTGRTQWDRPASPTTPATSLPTNPPVRQRSGSFTTPGGAFAPAAAATAAPGGLPEGWIEQKDPASGRPFYVHTLTGRTQWDRPSAGPARAASPVGGMPQPAAAAGGLPQGWIEQKDPASGRPFYVFTATGQTQWDRPTSPTTATSPTAARRPPSGTYPPVAGAPAAAAVAGGLPQGWIEQKDPASGRPFYVYTPTGKTQWDRPSAGPARTASPTGMPQPAAAGGLPQGWIEQRDPASGRPFYVYTPTGQTQWDRPGAGPASPTAMGGMAQPQQQQLPSGWIMQTDPITRQPSYLNLATGQRQSFPPQMSPSYIPHH